MIGFIIKLIAGRAGPFLLIGLAVALFGSMGVAAYQRQAAKRYQAERETYAQGWAAAKEEAKSLLDSIESKDVVIHDLRGALTQWQEEANRSARANEEAGKRADTYRAELNTARTRIRALGEQDRGNPDCDALLAMDLAVACPGRTEAIRTWRNRESEGK